MKKTNFKVGDKVFAKVKGYPPWPAHIIAENGKKYNVEFYGTGETGVIKVEDLFYYRKNKEKFQKPLKRKDYVDAFEQIEKAINEDGGDGDDSTIANNSVTSETDVSLNSSLSTPTKPIKKTVKRKRSSSEKSSIESTPSKRKSDSEKVKEEDEIEETVPQKSPETAPTKKSPKKEKDTSMEEQKNKFEFVQIDVPENIITQMEGSEAVDKVESNEKSETLDFKVEVISEKALKNNITYANYVKEKESIYKGRPVEPREDYINQVLPIKLPSGIIGGIKLHKKWPLKFENEYDRAIYDESVALNVLDLKQKIEEGDTSIPTNPQLFVPNIELSADNLTENFYSKDINSKKARLERLKIEADLMNLDQKIKNCLGLDKADPKQAINYLESMCKINFDDLMLKKHPHVVDMVRRLRKYVGNTKEWNMSEESLNEFSALAENVRTKAEDVYAKFKEIVKVPENATSFWDGFTDLVSQFRIDCKDMTEAQIYLLCAEPNSRQAFFDHLDEIESEKENSIVVANAESEPLVNGDGEKPATES